MGATTCGCHSWFPKPVVVACHCWSGIAISGLDPDPNFEPSPGPVIARTSCRVTLLFVSVFRQGVWLDTFADIFSCYLRESNDC